MKFTAKQYQQLARQTNISEQALRRILGSVPVEVLRPADPEQDLLDVDPSKLSERFNLGFRLIVDTSLQIAPSAELVERTAACIAEYMRSCPLIYAWIISGGFDPSKIPERVSRANLLHASRTVGRLRAKLIRV